MSNTARIFNIERFATEDGKGIRTVVFLKGCPLRCRWCANPESQTFEKQIMFNKEICVDCGRCVKFCPKSAIQKLDGFGYITSDTYCNQCGECIEGCYVNARSIVGEDYTAGEILEIVLKDIDYYRMSDGGVTFSGGEPLYYSEIIKECALKLKAYGLTTLVETCGHIPIQKIMSVHESLDYIYYDFKHINPEKHKELTGADNTLIIKNLEWLNENFNGELFVRYPYIPGCNDNPKYIEDFLEYMKTLKNVKEVIFLPYHRLGLPKYNGLGRKYEMGDMQSLKFKDIEFLKKYSKIYDISIRTG